MNKRYDQLPMALKKEIRELAGVVHERLLAAELRKLEREFARWRAGEVDSFALSALVHKFHEGTPRDIWLRFNTHDVRVLSGYIDEALGEKTLRADEVSIELRQFLAPK